MAVRPICQPIKNKNNKEKRKNMSTVIVILLPTYGETKKAYVMSSPKTYCGCTAKIKFNPCLTADIG
jgi:hypothetical protein